MAPDGVFPFFFVCGTHIQRGEGSGQLPAYLLHPFSMAQLVGALPFRNVECAFRQVHSVQTPVDALLAGVALWGGVYHHHGVLVGQTVPTYKLPLCIYQR